MPPFDTFDIGARSPTDPTPQQSLYQALISQQGAGGLQGQNGQVFNSTPFAGQLQPQQMSPLVTGLVGANQAGNTGGLPVGALQQAAQPQNNGLASAVGTGLRSLFDGVVGLGR